MTLHEPLDLKDAWRLLAELGPEARLCAGGTDLLVDLKTGRTHARHLISIRRIASMSGITQAPSRPLRIGAGATIGDLERSELLRGAYAVLREAAREMASPQIRNIATVGGNIAGGVPCADLPPVLGVLNATLVLAADGHTRSMPILEFFVGPRSTTLASGEILVAIDIPTPPARFGAAHARLALRDGNSIAVASAAAGVHLDDRGRIAGACMMLGAVAPVPKAVPGLEPVLVGQTLSDALKGRVATLAMNAAEPISDIRGSAAYRREAVGVLAVRAVTSAYARAMEAMS